MFLDIILVIISSIIIIINIIIIIINVINLKITISFHNYEKPINITFQKGRAEIQLQYNPEI